MTKRKTEETTTRKTRAKEPTEAPATEGNGTEPKAADAPATMPRGRKTKDGAKAKTAPKEKAPKEELRVFAFRLTAEERDAIHAAAGPAKASKYVRGLTLAASRGDEKTVLEIVRAVKEHLAEAAS
jgi:hypothetical protein